MSRRIAGSRRPVDEGMVIDYADVLRQAVDNERWRVLREVRAAVAAVRTRDEKQGYSYRSEARNPDDVKRDALAAIDRMIL